MKKLSVILLLATLSISLFAKANTVDMVFQKYSNSDGVVSLLLTSDMIGMITVVNPLNEDLKSIASTVSLVRVLHAPEDASGSELNDFCKEVIENLPEGKYIELLSLCDENQQFYLLADETNGIVKELLVIVIGEKGNSLISISGSMDMSQLGGLSKLRIPGIDLLPEGVNI